MAQMEPGAEPPEDADQGEAAPVAEEPSSPESQEAASPNDASAQDATNEESKVAPPVEASDPRDLRIRLLKRQLASSEARLHEYIRAHKKAQAEFAELRTRLEGAQEYQIEIAKGKVAERFLDVADNLDRSLEAIESGGTLEGLQNGVELVHKMFHQAMKELGLERFDPAGTPFDPRTMEAHGMIPVDDASKGNVIINTLRPGYRLNGRELRPALVQVGYFKG